ncbi:methyltransferase [Acetobacter orleanensis NRIC 0473]|uniref:Methyltransferase type 11 n=2 Tax=Acetobacter orleanensis TaxID=104099 RepID=A0A4Y3TIA4_9PROT|nr:methyltransferase [Acetobacter orleanensis JCM 7639]GBR27217.1 methyltransferase [Acetobacter orleanensis NRIC 0473]GEB82026.1 methyltransferase type 11 [Acetobacter orleanensis]
MHMAIPYPADAFYQTHEGQICAALLRERLQWFWPDLRGQRVLGLGYAAPYLGAWRGRGALCISARTPDHWPDMERGLDRTRAASFERDCVVDPYALPFDEETFDRIVLVHACTEPDQMVPLLRSAGRVLKDDGRVLMIVPSRLAGRIRQRHTPFARDVAFSRSGLRTVLGHAMLLAERRDEALFLPTRQGCASVRRGRRSDIAGKVLSPGLGSVMLVEAVKNVFSGTLLPARSPTTWFKKIIYPVPEAASQKSGVPPEGAARMPET